MCNTNRSRIVSATLLLMSALCAEVSVAQVVFQHTDADVNHLARDEVSQRLTPLGLDLMGDSIDNYTGTIVFRQVDVSLPGNSDLEVAVRRIATTSHMTNHKEGFFGDWILDVPNISSLAARDSGRGYFSCVGEMYEDEESTSIRTSSGSIYLHNSSYWDGMKLNIPGQGSRQLLGSSDRHAFFQNASWRPFGLPPYNGGSYSENAVGRVTKDHWVITCINPRAAGNPSVDYWNAEEDNYRFDGYVAISPDGTRYRMDKFVEMEANDYTLVGVGAQESVERKMGRFYATEVTDVHGNWVRYDWSTDGKLTRIRSNDGREITIAYHAGTKRIASVTANGRTWSYQYQALTNGSLSSRIDHSLYRVTQPDGKYWEYNLDFLLLGTPSSKYSQSSNGAPLSYLNTYVKHPYGARADYDFAKVRHARKTLDGGDYSYRITFSVLSKTLSGASIPTSVWDYDYEEFNTGVPFSGTDTKTTTITRPDGSRQVIHFYRDSTDPNYTSPLFGEVAKEELFSSTNTLLQRTENTYVVGDQMGRENVLEWNNANYQLNKKAYLTKTTVWRDGDTYTTENTYQTNQNASSYSYHKPTRVRTYSNISTTPRDSVTTLTHSKPNWVLGLVDEIRVNGRLTSSYDYDSLGRVIRRYRYGALVETLGYHGNSAYRGALYTVKDALNRTTYLLNYNAGMPRNIRRPDNLQDEYIVDGNGWVQSHRDHRGYVTNYDHDNMGRVTRIIPDQSLRTWREMKIRYTFGASSIVQHISDPDEEDYREVITYDQLFRPILELREDWYTEWRSYVNRRYNAFGQMEFESQPSTSSTETKGVNYTFDGLGRQRTETETVSPYAQTRIDYFSNHLRRVTNPNGNATTYRYSGYNGPGEGEVTHIYQPMGVTTYLNRNVHDQVTYVRQYGSHNGYNVNAYNYYYYDSRQRLCRYRTPEGGDTVTWYDNADRVVWRAKGQSGSSSCNQSAVPSSQRVAYTYDALDRVTLVNYPDSSPDVYTTYDANGNVLTKNRGGANWTYTYNELNKLTGESLSIDGRTYATTYDYNYAGYVYRQTTPFSTAINFNSDSFGKVSSVRTGSTNHVNEATYHPNGTLKSMEFGNGFYHDVILNSRQLPYRLYTRKGSTRALLLYYSYDANRNTTQTLDYSDTTRTYHRYFGYDALDRLVTANSSNGWGNGTFRYDPHGNLRQKVLGGRTVNVYYNSLNRVSSVNDTGSSRSFSYDARGNVVNNGERSFTYDQSNQPTYMSGAGTYRYDGNMKRVKSVVGGETIYSIYGLDGHLLYRDNVSTSKHSEYIRLGGGTAARLENGVASYNHNDLLGSALSSTTSSGAVDWREQYTPYGEKLLDPSANRDDVGFTGHVDDASTGLTYMQARYYDPDIGRFLSIDPVGFMISRPEMFGRYTYAADNPINKIDPDGQFACGGACVIGIGIAAGFAFDFVVEKIRGEPSTTTESIVNGANGGVIASTLPTQEKPRTGIGGGGPSGNRTSVASKANHALVRSPTARRPITWVLRRAPYAGMAYNLYQLGDAVNDRYNRDEEDEEKEKDKDSQEESDTDGSEPDEEAGGDG